MYDTVLRLHYELNLLLCQEGLITKGYFCCAYIREYKYRLYYTSENN